MSTWANRYLNIPFLPKGRTHMGVDCYGLVRLIYQEQLGIELPSYTEEYATIHDKVEIESAMRGEVGTRWKEIPLVAAKEFDGIIFRIAGYPTHFGLVLDSPRFIHAMRNEGQGEGGRVTTNLFTSLLWRNRIVSAVRYV